MPDIVTNTSVGISNVEESGNEYQKMNSFASYNSQYHIPKIDIDERSYASIYNALINWRRPDYERIGDLYDTPTVKYFKIFFHFGDSDSYNTGPTDGNSQAYSDAGLLAPTFLLESAPSKSQGSGSSYKFTQTNLGSKEYNYHLYNSAWAYLKNNGEEERAALLKYFILLLSDISTNYPWYFQAIEGMEQAIERKCFTDKEFKIDEERKKISIKCLSDAVDDRIGTLLDLYRSITYSWATKREILPANLRKFDMSIYVIEAPLAGITKRISMLAENAMQLADFSSYGEKYAWFAKDMWNSSITEQKQGVPEISSLTSSSDKYLSYKLFEFRNCEFDYNSSKTGLANLNNAEGVMPTYSIDISFDDCFEHRFNFIHGAELGDMIILDQAHLLITSELQYAFEDPNQNNQTFKTLNQSFDNLQSTIETKINTLSRMAELGYQFQMNDIPENVLEQKYTFGNMRTRLSSLYYDPDSETFEDVVDGVAGADSKQSELLNKLSNSANGEYEYNLANRGVWDRSQSTGNSEPAVKNNKNTSYSLGSLGVYTDDDSLEAAINKDKYDRSGDNQTPSLVNIYGYGLNQNERNEQTLLRNREWRNGRYVANNNNYHPGYYDQHHFDELSNQFKSESNRKYNRPGNKKNNKEDKKYLNEENDYRPGTKDLIGEQYNISNKNNANRQENPNSLNQNIKEENTHIPNWVDYSEVRNIGDSKIPYYDTENGIGAGTGALYDRVNNQNPGLRQSLGEETDIKQSPNNLNPSHPQNLRYRGMDFMDIVEDDGIGLKNRYGEFLDRSGDNAPDIRQNIRDITDYSYNNSIEEPKNLSEAGLNYLSKETGIGTGEGALLDKVEGDRYISDLGGNMHVRVKPKNIYEITPEEQEKKAQELENRINVVRKANLAADLINNI